MNGKKTFYTELSYVLAVLILALGTAFMERANFGISMVVAPAYLVHLWLSRFFPGFTFGMAEYCLQAVLLVVLSLIMGRGKRKYLLSFGTAVFYGLVLDGCIALVSLLPDLGLAGRVMNYLVGMVLCSLGVTLFFHAYISPEAYELFVQELAAHFGWDIHRTKTVYDCCSCAIAVVLSFLFFGFGRFEGVRLGTVLCALINGRLIGACSAALENRFEFRDGLPLRPFFEK